MFHKLVARTANDNEFVGILFLKMLQFSILRSVATFRGRIDDQYFLAFVLRKIEGLGAIQRTKGDIVDAFGRGKGLTGFNGFGFTKYTSSNEGANGGNNGSDFDDSHSDETKLCQLGLVLSV